MVIQFLRCSTSGLPELLGEVNGTMPGLKFSGLIKAMLREAQLYEVYSTLYLSTDSQSFFWPASMNSSSDSQLSSQFDLVRTSCAPVRLRMAARIAR
jgi:hypothetical protein